MSTDLKPPQAGAGDHALTVAKVVAAGTDLTVPGVGTALGIFLDMIRPPLEKRRDAWMSDLVERLKQLERSVSMTELAKNEQFLSILSEATQAATRTHFQEKRAALRNAVLNTARRIDVEEMTQLLFVRYVNDFLPIHLELLQFSVENVAIWEGIEFENRQKGFAQTAPSISGLWDRLDKKPRSASPLVVLASRELVTYGLTDVDSITTSPLRKCVTALGQQFLAYIAEPELGGNA